MIAWAFSFAVITGAAAAGLAPFALLALPLPLPDEPCWSSPALLGISAWQMTEGQIVQPLYKGAANLATFLRLDFHPPC